MTRTKTNKLVAILMAIFMAFAFMSFSLTYVSAADNDTAASDTASSDTASSDTASSDTASSDTAAKEETPKASEETPKVAEDETPVVTEVAPTPTFSFDNKQYGAPDVNVTIDFGKTTPKLKYEGAAKTPNSTDTEIKNTISTILSNIKVYKNYNATADDDKKFTNEVTVSPVKYRNLKFENNKVTFTVPLNTSTKLSAYTTFYLWLGPALNETENASGAVTYVEFKTGATTTSTTRTTYRTVSTTRTVKAKSANTGDNANLPLWIGLAAVAALMMGAVYFAKEKE